MNKLLLTLTLLLSATSFAQTTYVSNVELDNPVYGMQAELFNNSSNTVIHLSDITVSISPTTFCTGTTASSCHPYSPSVDGVIEVAFVMSNAEEDQCSNTLINILDFSNPNVAPTNGDRVTNQPCTPGGFPYNIKLANGQYNYNHTMNNVIPGGGSIVLKKCYSNTCEYQGSDTIPLGKGVSIWFGVYNSNGGFGVNGSMEINFKYTTTG